MAERKSLSKTTRFEVFKRDSFRCQYCGRAAPDVTLHVDHIDPVANGGDNDLLNLVTSCVECNAGKGARLLSDDSAVSAQRAQMEALQERREQIEMMLSWRRELADQDDLIVGIAVEEFESAAPGWVVTDTCRLRRLIKKYGLDEVLASISIAAEHYIGPPDAEGKVDGEGVYKASEKLPGILACRKTEREDPAAAHGFHVINILRKADSRVDYNRREAIETVRRAIASGIDPREIKYLAARSGSYYGWLTTMRGRLGE